MIETIENNKYNEQKNIETKDSDGPPPALLPTQDN